MNKVLVALAAGLLGSLLLLTLAAGAQPGYLPPPLASGDPAMSRACPATEGSVEGLPCREWRFAVTWRDGASASAYTLAKLSRSSRSKNDGVAIRTALARVWQAHTSISRFQGGDTDIGMQRLVRFDRAQGVVRPFS